jgi:circadian clock protein KaiB
LKDFPKTFRETASKVGKTFVLRLFVAGQTPSSIRAVASLRAICREYPEFEFDLQVIDVYQRPMLAVQEQIVAVPTLLKKSPLPLRRFIGDLSNRERLLTSLGLVS